jgi:predicted lipoprotein
MELHIIYTETDMFLSKARFEWHEIQDQYSDYKTSLGPWAPDAVIDYLAFDYPDLAPSAAKQVEALLAGESPTCVVTFK